MLAGGGFIKCSYRLTCSETHGVSHWPEPNDDYFCPADNTLRSILIIMIVIIIIVIVLAIIIIIIIIIFIVIIIIINIMAGNIVVGAIIFIVTRGHLQSDFDP